MCKVSITEAQRQLLEIITQVESGVTSPESAAAQLKTLKEFAPAEFKADYTLEDFQRIKANAVSTYETSAEPLTL
jgi:hypothetical protein